MERTCDTCTKPIKAGATAFYQEAREYNPEGPSDPINHTWVTCSKVCARKAVKNLDLR